MNIAIVGAGLLGRLIALSLHRQGDQITLFDKDDKSARQSAAYAAAGLLTPLGEAMSCEPNIVEMGFESLRLWPKLLANLQETPFFQQTGAIMLSHEQDKGDYLRFTRYLNNHYPQHQVHALNRQQLKQLEPEIARSFHHGLYLPQEGQIDNRRLLVALRLQIENTDINWLSECCVDGIESLPDSTSESTRKATGAGGQLRYQFINEQNQTGKTHRQSFDLIIDCRGNGANPKNAHQNAAPLKDLRAVRGELFQLFAPEVNISRPVRLMHPRYQLYIAPKSKGVYVVGATEIESGDNSPMTVRSAMELLSAAYSVHPGFAEANIRQHISQCRPAFSDNQPKIMVKQQLVQVNGLYRHGFLIAPVVVEQINQLVARFKKSGASFTNISCDQQQFNYSSWLPITYKNTYKNAYKNAAEPHPLKKNTTHEN
ncbi:MAG: FAD-dependent oxidoreductase [Alteromonadaceae bacterium]|nr:FAD-dependent oxidoreductase [Alteromonadaceae bacterium]